MCWVYLRVSKKERKVSNPNLHKFFSKGGDKNPHGWGVSSFIKKDNNFALVKEPSNAAKSMVAKAVALDTGFPKSRAIVGHLRIRSKCILGYRDTQPFLKRSLGSGKVWSFAHNGHLMKAAMEAIEGDIEKNTDYPIIAGNDSERLFCKFLDAFDRMYVRGVAKEDKYKLMESFFHRLNAYGTMCIVATDGDYAFAYRDSKGRKNLSFVNFQGCYTVSTFKLSKNKSWRSLNPGQLLIFRKGKLVFDNHKGKYRMNRYSFSRQTKPKVTVDGYDIRVDYEEPELLKGANFDLDDDYFASLDRDTYSSERYGDGHEYLLTDGEDGHEFSLVEIPPSIHTLL